MKKYTISTDEETDDLAVKRAILADKAFESLYDMSQELRNYKKYIDLGKVTPEELIDNLSQSFSEILLVNGVDLDIYYQ